MRYWPGYLSAVRYKLFAYGPADATATPLSLISLKTRMVYFLVLAYPASRTSRLVFTAQLGLHVRMPPVRGSVVRICGMMRTQHFWIRTSLSSTAAALHAMIGGRLPEWQTSKCISSVSFVRIESNFFTIHRRHRRKKIMDHNF